MRTPPTTEEEAMQRFEEFKSKDPFPTIPCALLNSADIYNYVCATGMLFPYVGNYLKSASYELPIGDKVIFWDEKGEKQTKELVEGESFKLRKNSIAFVTSPKLRIPDYIALRFNLRITNVHRGLLLGTGPLVDPGFKGNLLIPLHNLTTNDYEFNAGERLIWVEFTKLSPHKKWTKQWDENSPDGEYIEFRNDKMDIDPENYLAQASPHSPIRSSLPEVIENAQQNAIKASQSAIKAKNKAKKIKQFVTWGGIGALVAIGVSLITLYFDTHSIVQDAQSYIQQTSEKLEHRINDVNYHQAAVIEDLQKQTSKIQDLSSELEVNVAVDNEQINSIKTLELQIQGLREDIKILLQSMKLDEQKTEKSKTNE